MSTGPPIYGTTRRSTPDGRDQARRGGLRHRRCDVPRRREGCGRRTPRDARAAGPCAPEPGQAGRGIMAASARTALPTRRVGILLRARRHTAGPAARGHCALSAAVRAWQSWACNTRNRSRPDVAPCAPVEDHRSVHTLALPRRHPPGRFGERRRRRLNARWICEMLTGRGGAGRRKRFGLTASRGGGPGARARATRGAAGRSGLFRPSAREWKSRGTPPPGDAPTELCRGERDFGRSKERFQKE